MLIFFLFFLDKINNIKITVKVTLATPNDDLSINGGKLNKKYTFNSFHFHWGWNDYEGSFFFIFLLMKSLRILMMK